MNARTGQADEDPKRHRAPFSIRTFAVDAKLVLLAALLNEGIDAVRGAFVLK
jgi:hypothetical protein